MPTEGQKIEPPDALTSIVDRDVLPVTASLMLAVSLVAFEGLSVAAALPMIGADLGEIDALPWVITGYLLVSGLAIAITGAAVDALGASRVFRIGTLLFGVSSAACAAAPNLATLIGVRLLQGTAGGMLIATTGAAIGLAYPDALRSRVYALSATVWGVLAFGGPALAALLLELTSWRSLFLVSAPLSLLAAAIGWRALPGPSSERAGDFVLDARGTLLIAAFSTVTLLGLSTLEPRTAFAAIAAIALGWLYWRHARSHPRPLLAPVHTTSQPYRSLALVAGGAMAAGMGVETYLPLYLRGAREATPALVAASVLFLAIGWTLGSNIVSRLYDHVSEPQAALTGTVLLVPGLAGGAAAVHLELSQTWLFLSYVVVGLGIGVATNAALVLVQRQAKSGEIGRATAAHQFLRNMAVTWGTAIAGAALLAVVTHRLGDVEEVRRLLANAGHAPVDGPVDGPAGGSTGGELASHALAQGFVAAHFLGLALAAIAITAAWRLSRPLAGIRPVASGLGSEPDTPKGSAAG